jgi:hypothetical protein
MARALKLEGSPLMRIAYSHARLLLTHIFAAPEDNDYLSDKERR